MPKLQGAVPAYLFWGSAQGFSELNRTDLMVDSGHAALSADFNGDGLIDLAISCHCRNGTHFANSRVYYNDGRRFTHASFVELPTVGTHYMHRADVGNIYDRTYRQTYVSSVFEWEEQRTRATLSYRAEAPGESRLEFAVRAAASVAELVKRPWLELHETNSTSAQQTFRIGSRDRCMQYRAVFVSDNGDRYPALDRVEVTLSN